MQGLDKGSHSKTSHIHAKHIAERPVLSRLSRACMLALAMPAVCVSAAAQAAPGDADNSQGQAPINYVQQAPAAALQAAQAARAGQPVVQAGQQGQQRSYAQPAAQYGQYMNSAQQQALARQQAMAQQGQPQQMTAEQAQQLRMAQQQALAQQQAQQQALAQQQAQQQAMAAQQARAQQGQPQQLTAEQVQQLRMAQQQAIAQQQAQAQQRAAAAQAQQRAALQAQAQQRAAAAQAQQRAAQARQNQDAGPGYGAQYVNQGTSAVAAAVAAASAVPGLGQGTEEFIQRIKHKHNWFYSEQSEAENRINLVIQTGAINVPAPNLAVNYAANKKYIGHGNGHYQNPVINTEPESSMVEKEDPLASPYYDPLTGKVNIPEKVKAEQRQARAEAEHRRRLNDEENRLARYDLERSRKLDEDPSYLPFGDFAPHEADYRRMPKEKDVFFVSSVRDIEWIHDKIARIEKELGGELGFAMFDQHGLVALKDNSPYPLLGFSNFQLAYATAALMSVRGEDTSQPITFNFNRLNRDVPSPFVESLYNSRLNGLDGGFAGDPNSLAARRDKAKRKAALASAAKQLKSGNTEQARAEARANAKSLKVNTSPLSVGAGVNDGNAVQSSIGELLHYALSLNDPNAFSVLVDYLGSLKTLEVFAQTQGVKDIKYKVTEVDQVLSPILTDSNTAPLYQSARMMAAFTQDKSVNPQARQTVYDMLQSNQYTRNLIQKGVRESLDSEKQEIINSTLIYSQAGSSGYLDTRQQRPVVQDLALIEYRGQRVVMAISARNIKGPLNRTQIYGETAIAEAAKVLFDYERYRINNRLFK